MLHSDCILWSAVCLLLVTAHQNFPLQTEKWRSWAKQLIWLNQMSYWRTPWMKRLHLLNPLCLAFVWQKTGNAGQPAGRRVAVALSICWLHVLVKMGTWGHRVSDASEFPVLLSNSSQLLESVYGFMFFLSCSEHYPSLSVFSFPVVFFSPWGWYSAWDFPMRGTA